VTPRYAPPPAGVDWPTRAWPRAAGGSALDDLVDEAFTAGDLAITQAVVVVRAGAIIAERYGGEVPFFDRPAEPVTPDTTLLSWSMAKSMLHFVIGTLVDDGRVDPDAPAPVPEWSEEGDPRARIRVSDMLAMRDGLDWNESYEIGQPSDAIEMLFGESRVDVAGYAAAHDALADPGERFNYSSGTTNILSRVVADIVGRGDEYRSFLHQRLFAPLGMTSARPGFDATGVWVASTFVHATAQDFARFGLLYLRGGEWDGARLVSRAWTDNAQVPLSVDPDNGDLYSRHWYVVGDEYGSYWASGYEGQMIVVVPALDAVIVRLGRSPEENGPQRAAWRDRVIATLAR
jgi:CubicO group peptidase (beta-lactamase class C family)